KAGEWVRLEIDAEKIGLKPGAKITGMAFTQFGGTVYWDKAGIVTKTSQEDISATSELAWERQEMSKDKQSLPRDVREAGKLKPARRSPEQKKLLHEYYISNIYTPAKSTFEPYLKKISTIRKERDDLENSLSATMVSAEMEKPREAFMLKRGQYDQRGDSVQRAVPKVLPPLAESKTTNRLDFARWLVSPDHPLTS